MARQKTRIGSWWFSSRFTCGSKREVIGLRKGGSVRHQPIGAEALPVITAGYRSKVHVNQFYSTLSDNYIPHLRSLKITEIEIADVAKDLVPIWQTKVETASRLRGRIQRIFDYAEDQGLRSGASPAR